MPLVKRLVGRVEQQVIFPEVDLEKIANHLDVRHRAAAVRQPHVMPTETTLDLNEVAIEGYHRNLAAEGRHRAETMLAGAMVRGDELAGTAEPDFADAGKLAEQELDKHKTKSAPGIIKAGRELANAEHVTNVFRDAHRLHHDPHPPAPLCWTMLGIFIAVLLEALCNMNALAAGLPGGWWAPRPARILSGGRRGSSQGTDEWDGAPDASAPRASSHRPRDNGRDGEYLCPL